MKSEGAITIQPGSVKTTHFGALSALDLLYLAF